MKGLYSINLINSMRVDRAEIKTYGNVILTGENDAGKTAALRLWVYFITGNRKMLGLDEGSQDFCNFYFPKPNSWIIYEMFSDQGRYMIILSCRNNVIYSRYVDEPYRREYFFDDSDTAFERWEDIADKIGRKASDFAEVKGEENFRDIVFGCYGGSNSAYRRFALVRSNNAQGLRKAVQGVFLNKELIETKNIRDFILEALSLSDTKVEITKLKQLIQPVNEQWRDILLWKEEDEKGQIKMRAARQVVERYNRKLDKDVAISLAWKKLNYIIPRDSRRKTAIKEKLDMHVNQKNDIDGKLKERRESYSGHIRELQEPITKFKSLLESLDRDYKKFHRQDAQDIIAVFKEEDTILKTLAALSEEYRVLTSATGDVEKKYQEMLQSVLAPLNELQVKWNEEIRVLEEKEKTERLQIKGDYEAECRKIEEEHSKIISELNAAIEAKQNEIIRQKDALLQNEKEVMFVERKAEIDAEQKTHLKNIGDLEKAIADFNELINKEQDKCHNEVIRFKDKKLNEWGARQKELSKVISQTEKRLENIEGSFQKFLENEVPGWEDTIGKVVDEDVLFSKDLSPALKDEGDSLYGVQIDLSKTGKTPVSIDDLQKILIDSNKEYSSVKAAIEHPDIALQTEIARIEESYNKKIRGYRKESGQKEGLLADEKRKWDLLDQELKRLLKREKEIKENKAREINELIRKLTGEKAKLTEALNEENGENGRLKRLAAAKETMNLRLKGLEQYLTSINDLKGKLKENEAKIASEKVRIQEMKMKELSEKGLDTSHIESLSKHISELNKKKLILENKDYILFYGKYKEFVNEYSKKDYYDNQLKLAKEKMEEFEKEHKLACEKLEKDSLSLLSIINSEKGQLTSITKEIETTTAFLQKEDACPSYLMSSDYEINEEDAQVIISSITDNVSRRQSDLMKLQEDVHFFIKDFSIENIYGIKTIFSVGDDSTREYCEFAEWLQSFINTRRWEQNEEVSYTKFNDIIKEAAHECLETQEYLYIVDQTIGKMNKQLSNLNFSKIGFIQFRTRPSGNEVFGMLQKFKEFYMTYKEIIENKSPGVFAPDLGIEGIDQIRRKEIDLIKQLSDGLSRNNSSQISVKDTFEIDVRGKENNNEIPWTMSFTTFGSRGTSFVARTLINIVLIDVFKKNLGSQQNFIIHCVMDEIGQLDTENRKGILDFATLRNIYLVQAAPETMNGSDYTYVYFIQNIKDKCKFTQFVQN